MAIGVPRPLALEKPQSVDLAQAARYFGAHGEPDAATLALLQNAPCRCWQWRCPGRCGCWQTLPP